MNTTDALGATRSSDLNGELSHFREPIKQIRKTIGNVFIGPDEVVDALLVALFARGHVLLEGVPGVAKTTLVRAFSQTLDSSFSRIQFTPDLLPSDISGVYIPNLHTHDFLLRKGPIFANIVLGDEINRAPAKTQAALLEAMQESQVTIEGTTHILPDPFMVLATQNPVEQEGVYALPEAQLDRFLIKVIIGYPTAEQEKQVLLTHHKSNPALPAVLTSQQVEQIRSLVERVFVSDELAQYIVRLTRFTREHPQVALGASPRAALALLRAAKARAILYERDFLLPDDIKGLASSVLSHRILLHPEAEFSGMSTSEIVRQAVQRVPYSE